MWEYPDPYNWGVDNWAKFLCAGQAVLSNMYPTQGGTFHLIIYLYYFHLHECLQVWFIKLGWRKFGVRQQVKYCREKWVINFSFRYHESLFLIFEVFQFNESHYFPGSIFYWMKKSCAMDGKCPNFSVQLCLWMRGKLMLANFRL